MLVRAKETESDKEDQHKRTIREVLVNLTEWLLCLIF